jgi:hypothetical protein
MNFGPVGHCGPGGGRLTPTGYGPVGATVVQAVSAAPSMRSAVAGCTGRTAEEDMREPLAEVGRQID